MARFQPVASLGHVLTLALLSLVTLFSSTHAAEFSSMDTACARTYTVKADDTCDIIGQKTLTSTYQILAFNLPSAGTGCYSLETGAVSVLFFLTCMVPID
jgi:hypothetical protein